MLKCVSNIFLIYRSSEKKTLIKFSEPLSLKINEVLSPYKLHHQLCELFCSVCREEEDGETGSGSRKVNAFVRGTTNLKLETIKDHEISKTHRAACLKARNRKKPIQNTPAGLALSALTKAQTDRDKLLMRNAHAIIKNARPFADYKWMCL